MTEDEEEPSSQEQGFHLLLMSPQIFATQSLPDVGTVTIGRSSKCVVQIEDPLVSREHARLHVRAAADGLSLSIEDTGSANGTRVRDAAIKAGEEVKFQVGEAVIVGSTLMMALPNRASAGPRRLWSHAYFEARVE
ncbi:MAG TPA: FHA domain-containing protein, partial [Polyangia bacterium]